MIYIILFSVIALAIFIITFIKLVKENNSNYTFVLVLEFVGLIIDFIFILQGKNPNTFIWCIMYILNLIIPVIGLILEKNKINLLELINLFKVSYYENKDNKELAKVILLKNLQLHPNSYLSHKKMAEWYEKNNEYEKAESEYEIAIDLKPKNYDNYLKLANIYKQNGKNQLGIELLNNLLKTKPEYTEASIALGDLLYSSNMFKEAIGIYQEALKYNPGEYMLYYCMGMTYTRLNDFQNAKEYYKKASIINSTLNVAKLNLGQISLIFKEYYEAEKYFMECIESDDETVQAQAYYYLAKIKIINGQKELAIQYANIAIELDSKLISIIENDTDFATIIGKINLTKSKNANTKMNKKELKIVDYLNNTYGVVEKLTQNDKKIEKQLDNIEREI